MTNGWSKEACRIAIEQAAEELGRIPRQFEFNELPGPTISSVRRHYDSWNEALLEIFGEVNQVHHGTIDVPDDVRSMHGLCYRRGYAARLEGDPRSACPYETYHGGRLWRRGWDEADEELATRRVAQPA